MRRAPWLGLLLVSLASVASAAEREVGIVAGGLFNSMPALAGSTLTNQPIFAQAENGREFGPLGGLIFELSWQTFGALRFEPKYMRKGTQIAMVLSSGQEIRDTVELDYVSLPLLFKSTMFRSHAVQLVLISGLSADYLAKATFQGQDEKRTFESWDYTVTARIGIERKFSDGGMFSVQFNVASSLAGIDKGQLNQGKLKNSGIGFAVEYTHPVGGTK